MTAPTLLAPAGDPARLDAAAEQLERVAAKLAEHGDVLSRQQAALRRVWASDQASPAALAEGGTLHSAATECERCSRGGAAAVREYAAALAGAQQVARQLQQRAGAVEQDTRARLASSPQAARQILDDAESAYQRLQGQHRQALDDLDQAARRARVTLESLAPTSRAGTIGAGAATRARYLPPTPQPTRPDLRPVPKPAPPDLPVQPPGVPESPLLPWILRMIKFGRLSPWTAILLVLDSTETAERWRDEINQRTGRPYASKDEYDEVQRRRVADRQKDAQPTTPAPPPGDTAGAPARRDPFEAGGRLEDQIREDIFGEHKPVYENPDTVRESINEDQQLELRHSEALGAALRDAGLPQPGPNYEPHHIAAANDPRVSEEAREVLRQAGIGIDSADNGVWLPRASRNDPSSTFTEGVTDHGGVHTNRYYEYLNGRLTEAGPDGARDALQDIRRALHEGRQLW